MLLACLHSLAAPPDGELLRYAASWLGILAGTAEARTVVENGVVQATIRTRSANWVAGIYPVDDVVVGTWTDAGSRHYSTRFREGGFQQDQEMDFVDASVSVFRHQLIDRAWRDWTETYDVVSGLFDPVASVYRLREPWGEHLSFAAFSGRKRVPISASRIGADSVENVLGLPTQKVGVMVEYDGHLKQWMTVWFAENSARTPVRAVVETRGGPVTISLVEVGP